MRDFVYTFTIQGTLVISEESKQEADALLDEHIRNIYPFDPESGKITDSYSVAVNAVQITFSEEREEDE